MLELRAVRAKDDFDAYWRHHLQRERQRVHQPHYLHGVIPAAA